MALSIDPLMTDAHGAGAWSREARRVLMLAGELGLTLDAETLILCDVRDLMALRLRLQRTLASSGQPRVQLLWQALLRRSSR